MKKNYIYQHKVKNHDRMTEFKELLRLYIKKI
jgi:hypothetical protein